MEREFGVLNLLEPDQCFHRLVCDLATGRMPSSGLDFIATMFTGEQTIPKGQKPSHSEKQLLSGQLISYKFWAGFWVFFDTLLG